MKKVLKLIAAFLIGATVGLLIATIVVVLFMDITLEEFLQKLFDIDWGEGLLAALVGIVGAVIAIFIQIILHEGGHLVCGLLTGYRFLSFRILNWTLIREEGKLYIKRFAVAGTAGQCLLIPPERPLDEIPVVWYNLGGVLANLIGVLVAYLLFLWVELPIVEEFLFIFMLVGGYLILVNGIPMTIGGVSNDANNVFVLRKDKESKRALMVQLRANAFVLQGGTLKEMPREWFQTERKMDYKNPLLLNLYIMDASYLLDMEQWEEAHQKFAEIYEHKSEIMGLFVKEVACELLFTSLVTKREKLAAELYTDELREYIQQFKNVMSSKVRILCAVAYYMENDRQKAQAIYDDLLCKQTDYLMQGEVKSDLVLMKTFLNE